MRFSVIIPLLNEMQLLPALLPQIQKIQADNHEVIIVDGGSQDESVDVIERAGYRVTACSQGRAKQMNAGAQIATGDVLVFLHADTILPVDAMAQMMRACRNKPWGRFNVAFSDKGWIFSIIAAMMNFRSCVTGISTGDQCIFVLTQIFKMVKGFSDIPLMEDVALCKKLKRISSPYCVKSCVLTSARRWQTQGIGKTIVLMWYLRLAYFLGVSPEKLHRMYHGK